MAGIMVIQLASYYLGLKAEEHNLLVLMMVRGLFFCIQIVLFLIIDEKLHYFQFRTVCIMIVNGLFATVGGHLNPFYSYLVFYVVSRPNFKRRETELYAEIKEAFDHDDHLYYFARNIQKPKA